MNELTTKPKNKSNDKVLYLGIVISIVIVIFGGLIDATQVFGEEGTLPIIIASCITTGVIVGITLVSAKTGIPVKELVI